MQPNAFNMPCARCGRANVFTVRNPQKFPRAVVFCGHCVNVLAPQQTFRDMHTGPSDH